MCANNSFSCFQYFNEHTLVFLPCLQNESVLSATPVQIHQAGRKCKNCTDHVDVNTDLGRRSISHHHLAHQHSQINQRGRFPPQFQSKSVVTSSNSADTRDSKASPPRHSSSKKEHLSSIVREISQARLISLRKKRSGQSMTLSASDNGTVCDGSSRRATPLVTAGVTVSHYLYLSFLALLYRSLSGVC